MAKKVLFNPEDLQDAYFTIEERVEGILHKLSIDDLGVLAFALRPKGVAIRWGRDSLEEAILEKLGQNFDIHELMYDGNSGYSLLEVARLIKNNEI